MSNQEITLLRQQKIKAIEDCEFIKAKAIDVHLQKLLAQMNHTDTETKRMGNELNYELVKEEVRRDASEAYSRAYEKAYQTKYRFKSRIANLLSLHADQLTEHARDYAKALELTATRVIPEAMHLKREAQVKAKHGDFDQAEELFKQSNETRDAVLLIRQQEVKNQYETAADLLKKKQADELELNQEKKMQCLIEIQTEYNKQVEMLKNRLFKNAKRFHVEQDLEEEATYFTELDIYDEPNNLSVSSPSSPKSSRTPSKSKSRSSATTTPKRSNRTSPIK